MNNCDVFLYQIAYSNETLAAVEPGYLVMDNVRNDRPDWFGYWPIRNYLLKNELDENSFYGFFSPKFGLKTSLNYSQVRDFIKGVSGEVDVVLFSPQPDMGAFFLNVFEQAETFDSGFIEAFSCFLEFIDNPVALNKIVMDSSQIVFSNYFAAKPKFWREWLRVGELLFSICEGDDSDLKRKLCFPTSYKGAQRKVFIQERIASLLLSTHPEWRAQPYNPFGMAWSISRFRDFPVEAIISDALKIAFRNAGFPEYMRAFSVIRSRCFQSED